MIRQLALGLCAVACSASAVIAQSKIQWTALDDGGTHTDDFAYAVAVDAAGCVYLVGGASDANANYDARIVKFDAHGTPLWSDRYDQVNAFDSFSDVVAAPGGGVYVTGATRAPDNNEFLLAKYSALGVREWLQHMNSPGVGNLQGRKVLTDSNGNALAIGVYAPNQWLATKYDPLGNQQWLWHVGSGGYVPTDFVVTEQDESILVGTKNVQFQAALWLVALDANGTMLWQNIVDLQTAIFGEAIARGRDGRLVIVGEQGDPNFPTAHCLFVAEVDPSNGAFVWKTDFGGPSGSGDDDINALELDDEGVAWVAWRTQPSGYWEWHVARFDRQGTQLSDTALPVVSGTSNYVRRLHRGSAGQMYVTGTLSADTTIGMSSIGAAQLDRDGSLNWLIEIAAGPSSRTDCYDSTLTPDHRIAFAGFTNATSTGDHDNLAVALDVTDSPQAYCTAKVNSLGCTPAISFTGSSSASATSGFSVLTTSVRNQKNGLLIYSLGGSNNAPFQGGVLCVAAPVGRTPAASSAGNAAPASDCSGAFAFDMNAFAAGALGGSPAPALVVPGTAVHCQQWSRDPGASFNASLSNALRYVVLP